MTIDRFAHPALLVVDMQNDFVRVGAPLEVPEARPTIPVHQALLRTCRQRGIPVGQAFTRSLLRRSILATPAEGAKMLVRPSSQRTRKRGGSCARTSSMTPACPD